MTEEKPKTGCICKNAGFCNRHNITKTPHMHKLCQNHTGYFEAWENCKGPGQQNVNCDSIKETTKETEVVTGELNAKCEGCSTEPKYPSLTQQAKNFTKASYEHVMGGMKIASKEKQQQRMSICHACPLYDAVQNRCKDCGCPLAKKTSWETSKCPKGYW